MEFYPIIENALDYIEGHLNEKLTLETLSEESHTSKFYFHRLFSSIMGTSVNQYVLERKLNKALELMANEDLTLTQIAYDLDFSTQSAFTRTFKKFYGFSPKSIKTGQESIEIKPLPKIVRRDIKNLNGDIVTDFSLEFFQPKSIKGVVFQVDLAAPDFKKLIRGYADEINRCLPDGLMTQGYMVYSNCQPGSTKFNAMFAVEADFESHLENIFEINLPQIFCTKVRYQGDLLEISDIFTTDFARLLKIAKLEAEENHIELIQVFDHSRDMAHFDIYIPTKQLEEEMTL